MKKVNKIIKSGLKVTFGLMLLASAMFGQTFKATIVGQITDANGAIVPNATVTIIQDGTNTSQTAVSNDDGSYVITQLDPGKYTMRIEAVNFKTAVKNDLTLETAQSLRFNVALEVGDVSAEVYVTAEAAVVNTETSSKGEVIVQKQVQELPLNGRDFTDLALLTPGVYRRPADDDQGEGLATSGTRTDASNYVLDGVINKSDRNGAVGVTTSVDSIQEFKVETSTYTAEYGRSAGAQVNVRSKSGSNKFHGSLFDYIRNDVFDANNFFTAPDADKKLRRNDFGGTIGGPLPFFNFGEGGPVFHNGKDRSFFFFSYEGRRSVFSESAASNAPTASWLRGDFRDVRGAGNDGIFGNADDTNRVFCITTTGAKVECPTPNVIPLAFNPAFPTILPANPVSLQIAQLLPAANAGDPNNLTRYLSHKIVWTTVINISVKWISKYLIKTISRSDIPKMIEPVSIHFRRTEISTRDLVEILFVKVKVSRSMIHTYFRQRSSTSLESVDFGKITEILGKTEIRITLLSMVFRGFRQAATRQCKVFRRFGLTV